ncbi:Pyridoxal phosphate (PLP)-dependent transferases superfamily protein [Raphanus sativus]|nr:Pyridoxal phosphate (PLP)-dependent transferases superfamily protein [Raphanus sativus]
MLGLNKTTSRLRDLKSGMVHPGIVQKLAERKGGMSLGIGYLRHIKIVDNRSKDSSSWKPDGRNNKGFIRVEVVTASLGFLTNFEDVYRLWNFVAKFLVQALLNRVMSSYSL